MTENLTASPSDSELVAAARTGDASAFEQLVTRHFDAVFLMAYARTGSYETGEDIAQEVFVRAYLNLDHLHKPSQFAAWVCRIARNLAMDWHRSPQSVSRLVESIDVEQIPDLHQQGARAKMEKEEEKRAVRNAVQRLSPEHREVLLLHYCRNLNTTQIAEALGVHRTTIHYRLVSATREFRNQLPVGMFETAPAALHSSSAAQKRTCAAIALVAALPLAEKNALAMHAASSTKMAADSLANSVTTPTSLPGGSQIISLARKVMLIGSFGALLGIPVLYYTSHLHPRDPGQIHITVSATNTPIEQVVRELGRQTGTTIVARGKTAGTGITFSGKHIPLESALNELKASHPDWHWLRLSTQPVTYEIWDAQSKPPAEGHCGL